MRKQVLYFVFTVSLIAALGSLFLSEILHWTPCVLCWYQRTMLYPMVIIFAIATIKEVTNLEYIIWPLTIIGGIVAIYHNLLQSGIISEKLAPCSVGASCITTYHIGFNFLTVPLLSLLTFVTIAVSMIFYGKAKS